jgi:hypothetical protein
MGEVKKSGAVGGSSLKNKFKSLKIGNGDSKVTNKERKSRVEQELDEVNAYLKVYKQMNDTVSGVRVATCSRSRVSSGIAIRSPSNPSWPLRHSSRCCQLVAPF